MSLTNLGSHAPRDRADVVRGDRPRAAGGRCRPSGLPEPVRADRVRARDRRPPGDPPSAVRATSSRSGPPTSRRSRSEAGGVIQYETDRARFLGRGRSVRSPVSVIDGRPLSNTVGAVLDPIFSLRCRVRLAPGATAHAIFSTVVAESREEVLDLADKYREPATFERAATLAWTQAQVQLHHLGIEADEAHLFQRLANRILYSDPSLRPSREPAGAQRARGARPVGPRHLRRPADRPGPDRRGRGPRHRPAAAPGPRVLAAEAPRRRPRDPQRARRHLRPGPPGCARDRSCGRASPSWSTRATRATAACTSCAATSSPTEDRTLLQAAARAVLLSRRGSLADQVIRLERPERIAPPGRAARPRPTGSEAAAAAPGARVLQRARWLRRRRARVRRRPRPGPVDAGALAERDRQPVVRVPGLRVRVGLHLVREQPREPAHPVVQRPGRRPGRARRSTSATTTAASCGGRRRCRSGCEESTYVARHGAGYSRFEHVHDGIELDLVQFVPLDDPLKVSVLTIENRSGRARRLSVTAYAEWVLGTSRGGQRPTDRHRARAGDAGASSCATRGTPSSAAGSPSSTWAGGRRRGRPIGPSSSAATALRTGPAGLDRGHRLRGAVGAGLDPCAALQTSFELAAGARTAGPSCCSARRTAPRRRPTSSGAGGRPTTRRRCAAWRRYWDDILGTVQVRTPDRSMDIMLNRWLLYQTLACRLWAQDGLLPGRRRLRLPRPAPGRHRARDRQARARPGAPPAGRGPPVPRGRRPALVASAVGSGRPDPDLGRSPVAAVRRRSLPRGHGRRRRPRRDRPVPRGTGAAARPGGRLLPAGTLAGVGLAVRALRARPSTGASRSARTGCR